jgi:hypothetical protein
VPNQVKPKPVNNAMKKYLMISAILLLFFACEEPNINNCIVEKPLEELVWLNSEISQIEADTLMSAYWYISTALYQGNTVFVLQDCCPVCNTVHLVFNCSGEPIGYIRYDQYRDAKPIKLGEDTLAPIYSDNLTNKSILWKPDNFMCTL